MNGRDDEIAKVFKEQIKVYYDIENVQIVDVAELEDEPSNIHHAKDVCYFAFAGIIVALGYVFILSMLDNTIKSTDNFEKEYGVSLLVSIPLSNYDTKKKGGKK